MTKRFENKTVFVTGAGGGIGSAVARRLASEGAHVAAADLSQSGLEKVVAEISQAGGQASAHRLDVTSPAEVAQAIDEAENISGRVSLAVTCAGILKPYSFLELPKENYS